MSDLIIFDTPVLVDQLRTNCHRRRIETVNGLIRNSSVVMAELWRGVVTPADRVALVALARKSSYDHSHAKELAGVGQDTGRNSCGLRFNSG